MSDRRPRIVKARDRADASRKIVATPEKSCDTIRTDELREKFMELRRAYLSFEKFVKVDCGIEI